MKKKIKDFTLGEIRAICIYYGFECKRCPLSIKIDKKKVCPKNYMILGNFEKEIEIDDDITKEIKSQWNCKPINFNKIERVYNPENRKEKQK